MNKGKKISIELGIKREKREIRVNYGKRKTIKIGIEFSGDIFVVAPFGVKDIVLIESIKSKEKWILKKFEEITSRTYIPICHQYEEGEIFMYLGEEYPLILFNDSSKRTPFLELSDGKIIIKSSSFEKEKIKKTLEMWFREKTFEKITDSVNFHQKYFKERPTSIKVKEQKKRWASCTSKRGLLFNWRCSMAPIEVIDYIVVHEMCHMVYMNHSKEFWNLVQTLMPDYKEQKNWLKENGFKMTLLNY